MRRTSLSRFAPLAVTALLACPAAAQSYTFQIDSGSTSFTWTGTTSLGDITELPPDFTLSGTANLLLAGGGSPVGGSALVTGASALVSPDMSGVVPNSPSNLPPLATIDLKSLQVEVISPPFAVAANGSFSTSIQINVLSGTRCITPFNGTPVITDISGESSGPSPSSGTVTWNGSEYVALLPVNTVFPFSEPGSGITGNLFINGTMIARHVPAAPTVFCSSLANSTGQTAAVSFSGQTSLGAGAPTIHATQLPSNIMGLFFHGSNQIDLPFGNGRRCVGGTLARFQAVRTGAAGQVTQLIDNSTLPMTLQAGEQSQFQFWFRDVAAGGAGFNTSDALSVTYTP